MPWYRESYMGWAYGLVIGLALCAAIAWSSGLPRHGTAMGRAAASHGTGS